MFRPLLVPFIALAAWIGCAYVFGDPTRTSTPSFGAAQDLAPMQLWGAMFLAGAAVLTLSMFLNERLMHAALFVGGVIYAWWGALFALSAAHDPEASLVSPALYGFLAAIHFLAGSPDLTDLLRRKVNVR